jgi:N-acetylneuraminate synthase
MSNKEVLAVSGNIKIIAEAGVNHNGDLNMAFELIDAAAESGANAVKFQSYKTELLTLKNAPKAEYQVKLTGDIESQYEMLKKYELDEDDHYKLVDYCDSRNIEFMSTPFDLESLDMLLKVGIKTIKISSGDITNAPLLYASAKTKLPIILSSGMSTVDEINDALCVIRNGYNDEAPISVLETSDLEENVDDGAIIDKVVLMHCTTEYPAPYEDINLNVISTLKNVYKNTIGLSDHSSGIAVATAAAALGIGVIEKHLTLDKKLEGPDHLASLEPDEFQSLVNSVRIIEKSLGSYEKKPSSSELKNIDIARKSLYAATTIKKGQVIQENNITVCRPAKYLSPMNYWKILGTISKKDYKINDPFEL